MQPDHPQLDLLFAIDGDASDDDVDAMREAVARLAASRAWTIAPPSFVDEEDDSSSTDPEDEPISTVGGVLKLYSSFPPWREQLPPGVDRAQYNEVRAIVEGMSALSLASDLDIVFEYEGEPIGHIKKGKADRSLTDGLLGEWDRVLSDLEARGAR